LYDFAVTHTVSPGKANIIASVQGEFVSADGNVTLRGTIIINEVFPNPVGSDSEGEFIELYNAGATDVSLDAWKLGDASKSRYTFAGTTIKAGEYLFVSRTDTGLALNNSGGEEVNLYNPAGDVIDSTVYSSSAPEGESYARDGSDWQWTRTPTPGKQNSISMSSNAPQIVIDVDQHVAVHEFVQFDASDTTDADSDALTFSWEFGDGGTAEGDVVEYVYTKEGIYTVTLVVVDSEGNTSEQQIIITAKHSTTAIGAVAIASAASSIQITEFIPNPEGSDSTEFIELYNPTDESIDLSDLKLDDEEGGSRAYTIPAGTRIEPGQYLLFGKQNTKIALNNTNDSVRLMYPNGVMIMSVDYDEAREGASYALNEEGSWVWTGTPTPGSVNIFSAPTVSVGVRSITQRSNYTTPIIETTLEFLRSEDIGDVVSVTGVVAVKPGVLGSQYFYIVGSPGVQVYMYKKDFPDLKVGDRIRITGEISEALGETRIKLSERADIEMIDHVGIPTPVGIDISEIGEPYEGWLIGVDGEITERKSTYMYVDDGTAEVKVYFKRGAGIPASTYEVGELVRVVGIVSQTKDGYQILPRSTDDIVTTGFATAVVIEKKEAKQEEQAETIEKYLTATAGGLTSILFGLGMKEHGRKVRVFVLRIYRRLRKKKK
jgi:PKD repeat protein